MSVAVVVPLYNASRWVEGTLNALLNLPVPPSRIVVVDDGSHDGGPDKVAAFADAVTLLRQENRGACAARNVGLAEVREPFVIFLDADDVLAGDFIGGASRALQNADVAFAPVIAEWPDGRTKRTFHYDPVPTPQAVFGGWLNHYSQPPCSIVWRTELARRIGGWDERVLKNQDGEFAMRAMLHAPRMASFTDGWGVYRAHGEPSVSRRLNPESLRSELDLSRRLMAAARGTPFESGIGGFGRYLYIVARGAYQIGEPALGDEALALARAVGLKGHPGGRLHKLVCHTVGLQTKTRIAGLKYQINTIPICA